MFPRGTVRVTHAIFIVLVVLPHIWNEFVGYRRLPPGRRGWVARDVTTSDGGAPPSRSAELIGIHKDNGRVTRSSRPRPLKATTIRRTRAGDAPGHDDHVLCPRTGNAPVRAVEEPGILGAARAHAVWAPIRGTLNLGNGVVSPCEPIAGCSARRRGRVASYLHGQNPFVKSMPRGYNLPPEAVTGWCDSLYTGFRSAQDYSRDGVQAFLGCEGIGLRASRRRRLTEVSRDPELR